MNLKYLAVAMESPYGMAINSISHIAVYNHDRLLCDMDLVLQWQQSLFSKTINIISYSGVHLNYSTTGTDLVFLRVLRNTYVVLFRGSAWRGFLKLPPHFSHASWGPLWAGHHPWRQVACTPHGFRAPAVVYTYYAVLSFLWLYSTVLLNTCLYILIVQYSCFYGSTVLYC